MIRLFLFILFAIPSAVLNAKSLAVLPAHKTSIQGSSYTFSEHIAPIIWKNCVSCHRVGEIAPFSLTSYEEVAENALTIAAVTKSKYMPPWKPSQYARYANERLLTDEEIQILNDWAQSGAPEGDPTKTPPLPIFPAGSQLGTPDLVLSMPEEFTVKADFKDEYRNFVIPFNFTTDKNLSAVEFRPGNASVVHHVLMWIDTTGKARKKDEADPLPGFSGFGGPGVDDAIVLPAAWVPGAVPRFFPDKMGVRIPKGADLIMQIHYAPSGSVQKDRSSINLFYSQDQFIRQIREAAINPTNLTGAMMAFIIAPDTKGSFKGVLDVPYDFSLMSIAPHMHLIGKKVKAYCVQPNGDTLPLIEIKDWDFNWQGSYTFKKLIKIPKGSKVFYEAEYDNTSNNPLNPNSPPKLMRWGEKTTDEMFLCYFFGTIYLPGDENISLETQNTTGVYESVFPEVSSANVIPNPAYHNGILQFSITKSGSFTISIADIIGNTRKVLLANKDFSSGTHSVEIPLDEYESGTYNVRIYNSTSNQFVPFVVIK